MPPPRKVPEDLRLAARRRAGERCEYCGLPAVYGNPGHQVDHIVAVQHGGESELSNLAYACAHCNRYKGPNLSGRDPVDGRVVALFNPRAASWKEHFAWDGPLVRGVTSCGRATAKTLQMNHPIRVTLRERLIEAGLLLV